MVKSRVGTYIYDRLDYYKKLMNVKYNSVILNFIRQNRDLVLIMATFNLKIITLPKKIIDYIIVMNYVI